MTTVRLDSGARSRLASCCALRFPEVPAGQSHVVPVCFDSFGESGGQAILVGAEPNSPPKQGRVPACTNWRDD